MKNLIIFLVISICCFQFGNAFAEDLSAPVMTNQERKNLAPIQSGRVLHGPTGINVPVGHGPIGTDRPSGPGPIGTNTPSGPGPIGTNVPTGPGPR